MKGTARATGIIVVALLLAVAGFGVAAAVQSPATSDIPAIVTHRPVGSSTPSAAATAATAGPTASSSDEATSSPWERQNGRLEPGNDAHREMVAPSVRDIHEGESDDERGNEGAQRKKHGETEH